MKISFFIVCLFLFSTHLIGQDTWGLKDIVAGSYDGSYIKAEQAVKPSYLEKNSEGGIMEVVIQNKVGANRFCNSKYRFEWWFSVPLNQLKTGDLFNVDYKVSVLHGNCKNTDAQLIVTAASGGSPQYKNLGVRVGTGGIAFPKYKYGCRYVYATNFYHVKNCYQVNSAYGKVVPWGGDYASIRFNFESKNAIGSDRLQFEVVYLFQKNYQPTTQGTDNSDQGWRQPEDSSAPPMEEPNNSCQAWYYPVENSHPWVGKTMFALREQGFQEVLYHGSQTWGFHYYLKDPNGNWVRVSGSKVYYVNWNCFKKQYTFNRKETLANNQNLSYKDIWRKNENGQELQLIYLEKTTDWYYPAEGHPWNGKNIYQLKAMGYKEILYSGSQTWGWSYFLQDKNNRWIRIAGNKAFYVNWDDFKKIYTFLRTEQLNSIANSHQDIWKHNKTGHELKLVYLRK